MSPTAARHGAAVKGGELVVVDDVTNSPIFAGTEGLTSC